MADHVLSADDVSAISPTPSLELMCRQSLMFVDASPDVGQVFQGFELTAPKVE